MLQYHKMYDKARINEYVKMERIKRLGISVPVDQQPRKYDVHVAGVNTEAYVNHNLTTDRPIEYSLRCLKQTARIMKEAGVYINIYYMHL